MSLFESYELIRFPGNNTIRQTPYECISLGIITWILRYLVLFSYQYNSFYAGIQG